MVLLHRSLRHCRSRPHASPRRKAVRHEYSRSGRSGLTLGPESGASQKVPLTQWLSARISRTSMAARMVYNYTWLWEVD